MAHPYATQIMRPSYSYKPGARKSGNMSVITTNKHIPLDLLSSISRKNALYLSKRKKLITPPTIKRMTMIMNVTPIMRLVETIMPDGETKEGTLMT